jgi:hypothetical protein
VRVRVELALAGAYVSSRGAMGSNVASAAR